MAYMGNVDLCLSQLQEEENGQTQMKYQKTVFEVPKVGWRYTPNTCRKLPGKSLVNNIVATTNNGLALDVECDVEDWWNQIVALAEEPTIYYVRIPLETSRLCVTRD